MYILKAHIDDVTNVIKYYHNAIQVNNDRQQLMLSHVETAEGNTFPPKNMPVIQAVWLVPSPHTPQFWLKSNFL